jgi:transposase-like protein/IS1 family transposase
MQCPTCQNEARKFGRDRNGNQRYQCQTCNKTLSDRPARPLDEMRLSLDKALLCLQLLTEGNSIRATTRISGVAKDTVIALLVCVGEKCEAFLRDRLRAIEAKDVQADEIWGFVRMKEKTRTRKQLESPDVGDAYCFVAIERTTKLILAWYLGKRDQGSTRAFLVDVERSTRGRIQLSTDGFRSYPPAVQLAFVDRPVDHGTLVKEYATKEDEHRYSPGEVVRTIKGVCCGDPDPARICTSHVERHNLSMRMQNRRLTRLTNAFSKKWANHDAALGLYFAVYNYVRPHGTLTQQAEPRRRPTTPAMVAGLTDHPWTLLELLQAAASTH